MSRVVKATYVGRRQVYDLEVDHPSHQFYLANGLLTSNSHAVSYALDSFMSAKLLTHYEAEWLCAYIDEYSDAGDKKRAKALAEIKALGYKLVRPDINLADRTWAIIPGRKFMPSFNAVKSIGTKAVDEILRMRPYNSAYELLWNDDGTWKHSKFNKRAMQNLIKVGAFASMDIVGDDKYFANYKHMHDCIIDNWAQLRKKSGPSTLDELAASNRDAPDWSREEKVSMYMKLVGAVDADLIIPERITERFREKGVKSIDDAEPGSAAIHWFIIVDTEVKKTKKGNKYLKATVIGESGSQKRMNIWGYKPERGDVKKYFGYLAEVETNDWGMSTVPWKMRVIDE